MADLGLVNLRRGVCLAILAVVCGLVTACGEAPAPEGFEKVTIGDRTFMLELAVDDTKRIKGLGGRESLKPDHGMLFVFKRAQRRQFVMRDCLMDIDIIYLDAAARIVSMYTMKKEEPQREGESDFEYNNRLKKYPSRFGSQFVIELAAGEIEKLRLKPGMKIDLDTEKLKAMAK